MVRVELERLKQEILSYVGIPYFINIPPVKLDHSDPVMVGKGTSKEIALKTIEYANDQKIKIMDLSPIEIYRFQKKHRLGIDCSGLAYNLLKFMNPSIDQEVINSSKQTGVTHISANDLTNLTNATPVTNYSDIQPGDLIRIDNGKHVIFIIERISDVISCVHSSQKTKTTGVHFARVEITEPSADLSHQKWSDVTKSGDKYNSLIQTKNGDGIYRLNLMKNYFSSISS
jgi:hypothetical protein